MKYECNNFFSVRSKVYELTRTIPTEKTEAEKAEELSYWMDTCARIKADAETSSHNWDCIGDFPAFDEDGNAKEVGICVGYDTENGVFLVWMEE